jgi:branched-chain amino acid transport system ATP-binding protein
MTLLSARDLHGGYGGADILNGVDLRVEEGEIVVIIGPNGAGKSTAMKAIFGLLNVREGSVVFEDEDITNTSPDKIVRKGMGYVPQERNIFPNLSVHENLEMGAYIRKDDISGALEHVYQIFPPLLERMKEPAGVLSGGQRQMVAMGRAMMLEPHLLLLDEPTAGLSPKFVEQIFERIIEINRAGISILMVEQNARHALELASRGYVLANGENRYEDTGPNLLANEEVARSFLGGGGEI